ncbi:uncharacterized protein [Euwallacea similis]|uniref:uncharacterized protein n=1 Tax=Euwallacea similis TaxID=1736056 RepID=UPI0034502E8B
MSNPTDVSSLCSFLGLVNQHGRFTEEHRAAIDKIKDVLLGPLALAHFNPDLPLIVAADASQYEVSCVLLQRYLDGSIKAIYHSSRAFNKAQKKSYDFNIKYIHITEFGRTDALSCLIAEYKVTDEEQVISQITEEAEDHVFAVVTLQVNVSNGQIVKGTTSDPTL